LANDPRVGWLRLARVPGIGPVLVKRLLETFQTPEAILTAHPAALAAVEGIGTVKANQIVSYAGRTEKAALEELERIEADGLLLLTQDHPGFPPGLKNITDPPLFLYVRGEIRADDAVAIGIVGARECTLYGREQAHRFSAELAQMGLCIVSGGARGIDTAAHNGALRVKGRTLVVQGCGLRHTYPPENKALYERIVKEQAGAILSEFPLDAPPTKENFPPRNRIIAGLSLGILVVEANLRSGSLITARLAAADYGREVFALPGPITSPSSAGTHHLIKTGSAHLVDSVEDILQNLGEVGAALLGTGGPGLTEDTESTEEEGMKGPRDTQGSIAFGRDGAAPVVADAMPANLTMTQQTILRALEKGALSTDEIIEATEIPASLLIAELTVLQIQGNISRLPANRFERKKR
jgi:DNA processing protein